MRCNLVICAVLSSSLLFAQLKNSVPLHVPNVPVSKQFSQHVVTNKLLAKNPGIRFPQGSPLFAPALISDSGGNAPSAMALVDINHDGKPDLIVGNGCASGFTCLYESVISVMLGNGDGTFQTAVDYQSGGVQPTSIAIGDVNKDGNPDIVVANLCIDGNCPNDGGGGMGVLLGNGDGTFQPTIINSNGINAYTLALADFNGDGKLDAVIGGGDCEDSSAGCTDETITVALGNGDGTFGSPTPYYPQGVVAQSVAVGDVNGDGIADIVANACTPMDEFGCSEIFLAVLLGNKDGTFQPPTYVTTGDVYPNSIALADVNADGKLDAIIAGGGTAVFIGNGDGTFRSPVAYSTGGFYADWVAAADVNKDGKLDLLVSNACNTSNCGIGSTGILGVLLGNGDGTFQNAQSYGSGAYDSFALAVADVNMDSKPDVAMLNACPNYHQNGCPSDGVVGILLNLSLPATNTSLSSSLNPSTFGQSVTFTAAVTSQGSGAPTGTVNFLDGSTRLGTANLNGSEVATFQTSTLAVGTHKITAAYGGDSNFAPSTSPVLNQVVQGSIGTLNPLSQDFGSEMLGVSSGHYSFVLTNTGNVAMTISSVTIGGSNSGDFTGTNNCPASLAPNANCYASVMFVPLGIGARSALLSFIDSATNSPQTASLSGTGTIPGVGFSPSNLIFNNQAVGTVGPPQAVTLFASGTLTISSIETSSQYRQTNNCGTVVPAGGNCQINVSFAPTIPGLQNGTLTVTDNGINSPQTVPLSGTATQPAVTLQPTSLNFGNETVGIASTPMVSVLTNIGNGTLNISSIVLGGVNSADFVEQNNCPKALSNSTSCQITVTFNPKGTGNRVGSVTITDDAPGSPHVLPLSGTGVLPAVTLSPTSLSFPDQTIFTTSALQKITLTNTGLGILKISGGGITGQFAETNNCSGTLAPGASCSANVTFKPTKKGVLTGSLSLTDNAPGSPQKVSLSGTGTYLQITPASVNFGNQPVHTTSLAKTITISNKGSGSVNFSGISISGADAGDFAETDNCGNSVASGASCFMKVKFTPSQQGARTADVLLTDDGGGSPQTVPLTGTGTP